jgi:hypothetical protein
MGQLLPAWAITIHKAQVGGGGGGGGGAPAGVIWG